MSVINTNIMALMAQNAISINNRSMTTAMEQLSTGRRINSAKDDAAGLAISQNMTAQIQGLNQAIRNANDGISMLQTAEGAMIEQSNMLQRMRELAIQAANDTLSDTQKGYLHREFEELRQEINRIGTNTQWNGETIINGESPLATGSSTRSTSVFRFQVGGNANQTISIAIGKMTTSPDGSMRAVQLDTISTTAGAQATLSNIDNALQAINTQRATIGAVINRLTFAIDNLSNISMNAAASRSQILDTDYSAATTELARTQIIQQAATAMLAQANQQPSVILTLLQ